ncbi:MAG: hypothetical protein D6731_22030 [Planctomycetota bacterium]|nr:MAG: hypothetical protein D6731_22030 [Planctomycetota bacterium]
MRPRPRPARGGIVNWQRALEPLVERLRRRRATSVGAAGRAADRAAAGPVGRWERWQAALRARAAEDGLRARFGWRARGRDEVPLAVVAALNHCQKPYHLWNCERPEAEHPFALERVAPLAVGRAVEGERGLPERVETSSRCLAEWTEEQAFEALVAKRNREHDRSLLRRPLPFGKPDREAGLGPRVASFGPPGGPAAPPGGGPPR